MSAGGRSVSSFRSRVRALRTEAGERTPTLEELVTSPGYFGLEKATPLQRAICRIGDGRPLLELAEHPHVLQAIGDVSRLPLSIPALLALLAGIRSAKSMIASAAAVRMSQRVQVSHLTAGEVPRISIVSLVKDLADVVRMHLIGNLLAKPKLKALLLEEPTAERVLLRHPSGRPIEITMVAGMRAGSSLVARWCAGAIFDEAPRMVGASEGVVNLDDMRTALAGRMLPGSSRWEIGSPWAPFGPVYKTVTEHEGRPSADVVVIRARGSWMNPSWWTPEHIEAVRRTDPTAYATDELAQFADPEESLFSTSWLDAVTRQDEVEPPLEGHEYCAAMDPATRSNAWTLAIGTRRDGVRVVCKLVEWKPSPVSPLDPEAVFAEIKAELVKYRVDTIETDQWSTDALRVVARRFGLLLAENALTSTENTEAYLDTQRRGQTWGLTLPRNATARTDMQRVKKITTQGGLVIKLPVTQDGRHCDYAPVIVRVTRRFCREYVTPHATTAAERQAKRLAEEQAQAIAKAQERYAPKRATPSWRRRP